MLQITSPNSLSKLRYRARKRGFRVLRDGCGCFSVISTQIKPPRPLVGLDHVPLWVVEQVIATPLPEPPPRQKRVARLSEPISTVQATVPPAETGAPAHAHLSFVETLRTKGGAS